MKKILFLVAILTLSVFSTACINNMAVQELNNKALDYMKKGDYENAISRFKSSADLDGSIFETQYNLAVAYTENEDYKEAIETFEKAIQIKSDYPALYYSMGVMYENYAKDLFAGNTKEQKEALEESDDDEKQDLTNDDGEYKVSDEELQDVKKYYNESVSAYSKYLELSPTATDTSEVNAKIDEINAKLEVMASDNGVATN